MVHSDLQAFLRVLEREKELHRVKVEVDPELEITEIATRVVKEQGPALLFEHVRGSPYPLAINVLGSRRRVELALGGHPEALGEEIGQFLERLNPPSMKALWESRGLLRRMLAHRPTRSRRPPCQEVVEQAPDLTLLPALKCWPGDGGRFLTLPLVLTRDPQSGHRNLGIYRMQVFSRDSAGMHWQIQKGGSFHYFRAVQRGVPLQVGVALGGDPALLLVAAMPLPDGIDEVILSGLLRGKGTPMARGRTISLDVPANAEFILEGEVHPGETAMEGPFGDHFGHYSESAPFPVFHLRAITRRRNPVYLATVVGKPPQEDTYIGNATQDVLRPLIKVAHPEINDLWAYSEAGFHNLLVVAVQPRYATEQVKTALGLLGEGQLALTKCLVLVDATVSVRDPRAVLRAIRQHFTPEDDLILIPHAPRDTLDFTSLDALAGGKMILDATSAGPAAPPPEALSLDPRRVCPEIEEWTVAEEALLVVKVRGSGREIVSRLTSSLPRSGMKLVVAVSADINIHDRTELLWGVFVHFDPARDIVFSETELRGATPVYHGVMGIDATFKPGYPATVEMLPEIKHRVSKRWDEYWR
ncbi:MAG: menaquinone biosynthesis decarboxylase [Chloroflexi bacterium]|nr:menaquinone biosynthesis decarboxylase [Chloroflexota bacterium]